MSLFFSSICDSNRGKQVPPAKNYDQTTQVVDVIFEERWILIVKDAILLWTLTCAQGNHTRQLPCRVHELKPGPGLSKPNFRVSVVKHVATGPCAAPAISEPKADSCIAGRLKMIYSCCYSPTDTAEMY